MLQRQRLRRRRGGRTWRKSSSVPSHHCTVRGAGRRVSLQVGRRRDFHSPHHADHPRAPSKSPRGPKWGPRLRFTQAHRETRRPRSKRPNLRPTRHVATLCAAVGRFPAQLPKLMPLGFKILRQSGRPNPRLKPLGSTKPIERLEGGRLHGTRLVSGATLTQKRTGVV